jgi:acyl carrier protein phosphodiesterase
MNHLAHALVAGDDPGLLLGGMLGDFWRGAPAAHWPAAVQAGVRLHRRIDVYTDSHPRIANARALFAPPLRRYAGIMLDVYFDHVLARDWNRHASVPLDLLSARVSALLRANRDWLPPRLNRFAEYFDAAGLFAGYSGRAAIERVLAGIGQRLTRANPLAQAGPQLWARERELEAAFAEFFPDLVAYAAAERVALSRSAGSNPGVVEKL